MAAEHREPAAAQDRGATVYAWIDLTYYDGLLSFAQGCYVGDGPVVWMGESLAKIEATR